MCIHVHRCDRENVQRLIVGTSAQLAGAPPGRRGLPISSRRLCCLTVSSPRIVAAAFHYTPNALQL
jgi:hypothetical protein